MRLHFNVGKFSFALSTAGLNERRLGFLAGLKLKLGLTLSGDVFFSIWLKGQEFINTQKPKISAEIKDAHFKTQSSICVFHPYHLLSSLVTNVSAFLIG